MEHHSSTHYLMWKLQSEFPATMSSFRPSPFFQESLVWPPRSYPCSFCRREFRSAQALGGHMNVHRRDRAKLKQSPPPQPTLKTTKYGGEGSRRQGDEDDFVCKRHKVCSSERCFSPMVMEEIDLELRLGAPAVKLGQIS